ncbi:MAG: SigE family RNA polymerase sigma factor [Nocardioides sp.]
MSPHDEPAGFEEFVAARRAALHRSAYLLTGDVHDAEDLVQVALVKAAARWARIADHPEPYVRRILVRESVTRWRRRRWRELPYETVPDRAAHPVDSDSVEALRRALDRLSARQRAVVVLRYYDDLTERQTADVLGISVGTVKSHARDALTRLRDIVPEGVLTT